MKKQSVSIVSLAVILAMTLHPKTSDAQTPEPLGDVFEINELAPLGSYISRGAAAAFPDAAGRFLVVWNEFDDSDISSPQSKFFAQRYDEEGRPLNRPDEVPGWIDVVTPEGDYFATWLVKDAAIQTLFARRYNLFGKPTSEVMTLHQDTSGRKILERTLGRAADGRMVLLWRESQPNVPNSSKLFVRRFNAAGQALGGPQQVDNATASPRLAHLTVDPDGSFAVAWQASDRSSHVRRFLANGQPRGETVSIANAEGPMVAKSRDGGFVVVWNDTDFQEEDIFSQSFDSLGQPQREPMQINTYTTVSQTYPRIAAAPGGDFVVAWTNTPFLPSYPDDYYRRPSNIRGRRLDPHGVPLGEEIAINTEGGFNFGATPAMGRRGDFMVVWAHYDISGFRFSHALARRFALGPCRESESSFCLGPRRFRVTVQWRDFQGKEGFAKPVGSPSAGSPSSDQSELLYFFSQDNWEMVVKVLDGCAQNEHYWVFAATASGVEFTLTVEDLVAGTSKVYHNPLGQEAVSINDTTAFKTCSP